MARRKHRRNPRAKYKVRHVVLKKNGAHRRRLRRNGPSDVAAREADAALSAIGAGASTAEIMAVEGRRSSPGERYSFPRPQMKRVRAANAISRKKEISRLQKLAKRTRKGAKGRGVGAMAKRAQAGRIDAIAAVLAKRGTGVYKSPLIKAMTVRANPSIEDVKILGMQAVAGAAGFVGMAAIGKFVADMVLMEKKEGAAAPSLKASYVKEGKRTAMAKYAPAVGTLAATLAGLYLLSGKTKYAVGLTIGGMSAAMLQVVLAKDDLPVELAKDASTADKVKSYLGLGEYTTVGSGIFHGVGEYTAIGQAHPFRPRNFGDDQMEWASTGGLGAMLADRGGSDNRSEFAPGEGGIFSKTPLLSR